VTPTPFVPPTYPFDRLDPLLAAARALPGGAVDLSIGTPCDPPPPAVLDALVHSGSERGYPSAVGSRPLLDAARGWMDRRFGVALAAGEVAACVGTKELVAGLPHWLRLRQPERDVVLYPAVSYPTYAMGAALAGARAVPVPLDENGRLLLDAISPQDAASALCLWVNSPSNPTGALDDLAAIAAWGRRSGVLVCSDECYAEFTWADRPRTILEHGLAGVLAVHSISKRSNAAGLRCGFYAGDPEIVFYLAELRRHAGFMVPGPVQAAAAAALADDAHVEDQRGRYLRRLERLVEILAAIGVKAELPGGGFYLWVSAEAAGDVVVRLAPGAPGDESAGWALTRALSTSAGALVSPGEFYAPATTGYVRIAAVQPDERLELVAQRLGVA
jgi:aspartate/methionine/tyrosine aminotransferase